MEALAAFAASQYGQVLIPLAAAYLSARFPKQSGQALGIISSLISLLAPKPAPVPPVQS